MGNGDGNVLPSPHSCVVVLASSGFGFRQRLRRAAPFGLILRLQFGQMLHLALFLGAGCVGLLSQLLNLRLDACSLDQRSDRGGAERMALDLPGGALADDGLDGSEEGHAGRLVRDLQPLLNGRADRGVDGLL